MDVEVGTKEYAIYSWKIGAIKKVTRSTDNDSPSYQAIKRSLTYRLISDNN